MYNFKKYKMILRQIWNEYMSKILFNSLTNKGMSKMSWSVLKAFWKLRHLQEDKIAGSDAKLGNAH